MKNWLVLLAFVAGMGLPCSAFAGEPTEISAQELKTIMDNQDVLVVFPLSEIEYNNLAIPGSVQIAFPDLQEKLPANKEAKIAFYCLGRK